MLKRTINYFAYQFGYKIIRYETFKQYFPIKNAEISSKSNAMLKNENSADVFYEQGMENSADISYEKNMENSADFFYKQGMLERANKNNDMAFKYFARAIALNRCEPASKELKKMASECFQAAIRASDTNEIKRLLVRACEMDSANEKMKNYAKKIFNDDVPDLTKKCFIFYDGDRAQQIHGEAYKRALEFVTLGGIVGDVLEFGVLGGWSARIFCETMRELNNFSNIHLFDSFEGLPEYASQVDLTSYEIGGRKIWQDKMRFPDSFLSQFGEPHEKHIHKKLSEIIRTERIIIHKGFYSDIFKKNLTLKASIVHIDCDLYQSTCEVLWGLYKMEALQDGCVLLFDDWNCNKANPNYGERRAFKEFLKDQRQFTASNWYSYGYNGMAFILHDVGT